MTLYNIWKAKVIIIKISNIQGDCPGENKFYLLNILEKNDINKTWRSPFEKMFLFMMIFC